MGPLTTIRQRVAPGCVLRIKRSTLKTLLKSLMNTLRPSTYLISKILTSSIEGINVKDAGCLRSKESAGRATNALNITCATPATGKRFTLSMKCSLKISKASRFTSILIAAELLEGITALSHCLIVNGELLALNQ